MTTDKYFDKFPVVNYANNLVVDITKRVTLLDRVSRNPYFFHPFEIGSDERADHLSHRYYEDSYKSWLVYLTNNITDPYYEWYLSAREFDEFIEKKYGSIYKAENKIKHYRNDWESNTTIQSSEYEALPASKKKYWNPTYDAASNVLNYTRKPLDWITRTNKVVSYAVNQTNFIIDEICNIVLAENYVGKGQVAAIRGNRVYLQHVSGAFDTSTEVGLSSSSYIYGTESETTANVSAVTLIASSISEEELIYWKPITYYQYEFEKNEYNKTIRLIDSSQAAVAVDNLTTLLETD
jgi:hypothetical protein